MTEKGFYHAFEAAFRGSRDEIGIRLRAYLPFLEAVQDSPVPDKVLDLGCGRGEWLELVTSLGFAARGVDLDERMLADCRALGLDVALQDALEALAEAPTRSLGIVSAFHLVEHLPLETVLALVREAKRVLAPGGLLILETPNAENISVGTVSFHNDPTHVRPIPPPVLKFLTQHAGFKRAVNMRLNERPSVAIEKVRLRHVLRDVSPDYAVVAQKAGRKALLDPFRPLFSASYGLRLETLADRFEARFAERGDVSDVALRIERAVHALRVEQQAEMAAQAQAHADLRAEHEVLLARFNKLRTKLMNTPDRRIRDFFRGLFHKTPPVAQMLPPLPCTDDQAPQLAIESAPWRLAPQEPRGPFGPISHPFHWALEGPFDTSYSLALVNRELARALQRAGTDVALVSAEGPGPFEPDPAYLAAHPDLARMHDRGGAGAQITSRNMYPPRAVDFASGVGGLHSYAWEESGVPDDWVDAFNANLGFMTVVSPHVRKVMIDNGVAIPIHVVGNGVDHLMQVAPEDLPEGVLPNAGRTFLHVSSCFPRKGADALLEAWRAAFTSGDDVALVIKTFDNPHNDIRARLRRMQSAHRDMAPVHVISDDLTPGQMRSLYRAADVVVLPSRAEGFCLPIAEGVLEGARVITTGWGGQMVFRGCPLVTFVPFELMQATTHHTLDDSLWAEPDQAALASALREGADAPRPDAAQVAEAEAWLMARLSWDAVAARSIAAIEAASATAIEVPPIGWITTYNSRCGIATYSEHLIGHIGLPVAVLAPEIDAPEIPDDEARSGNVAAIHRVWRDDSRDPMHRLADKIAEDGLEMIVIQFNYGFFDFASLARLIHRLKDEGRQVVMMMHNTNDAKAPKDRQLGDITDALARCDRLLVHKIADAQRLAAQGLAEQVALFPHGILPIPGAPQTEEDGLPIAQPKARVEEGAFVIGCYGFLLDNKGLPELIDAVALLHKRGQKVYLRMMNAEYPAEQSQRLRASCQKLIEKRGLAAYVDLDTRFRPDGDTLRDLSTCDLVVYPYQHSAESASGAVRYGLAAGRPVAVTPLDIFSDVSDFTLRLPGRTPREMADGIESIIKQMARGESFAPLLARGQAHVDRLAYTRLGPRLRNLLMSLRINPEQSELGAIEAALGGSAKPERDA